jgi:hypothetical protein
LGESGSGGEGYANGWGLAYSVQRSKFSVQRSAFSVQRTAFSVQGTAISVQRSAYSVQRSAFSVQRSAFSVQRTAFSVQRTAFRVQRTAFSVQRTAYSVQRSAYSVQRTAYIALPCSQQPRSVGGCARGGDLSSIARMQSSSPAAILKPCAIGICTGATNHREALGCDDIIFEKVEWNIQVFSTMLRGPRVWSVE